MPSVESPARSSEIDRPARISTSAVGFWVPLGTSWIACAIWIWIFLLRQWVPHDEGAFADIADRILRGEVPHRDFLDLYTGGLGYLHAVAWKLFGRDLAVFRYVLYAFALAWLPALYYVNTRFVRPAIAAALLLIAVAFSIPRYPAAVPSWYNLFFATWGAAALLRFIERRSRWWLFVAGVCGGLSFLVKVSGLFFVFAAALFLVYRSQEDKEGGFTSVLLRAGTSLAIAAIVLRVIGGWLTSLTFTYFLLPPLIVAGVLLAREVRLRAWTFASRFDDFVHHLIVLAAGVALPIACYVTVYLHGGFKGWIEGVFILPARRLQYAETDPPPLYAILMCAGVWILCGLVMLGRVALIRYASAAMLIALPLLAFAQAQALTAIWYSLAAAIPLAAIAGARLTSRSRETLFLLMAVTVLCSLVQFPFAAPVYFCYIAPLVVVLIAALFSATPRLRTSGIALVLGLYLFAGFTLFNRGTIYSLGDHYARQPLTGRLNAPGARKLQILPQQADLYNTMIPFVQQHAGGDYVYAAPSAPEVYFLSGHRNPAHWTFDFFDDHAQDPAFVSAMLQRHGINVVAINTTPDFDPAPSTAMMKMYEQRFPHEQKFGRFVVRWRE